MVRRGPWIISSSRGKEVNIIGLAGWQGRCCGAHRSRGWKPWARWGRTAGRRRRCPGRRSRARPARGSRRPTRLSRAATARSRRPRGAPLPPPSRRLLYWLVGASESVGDSGEGSWECGRKSARLVWRTDQDRPAISGSFLPLGGVESAAWAMTIAPLRPRARVACARGELVIDGDGLDRDGPPAPRVWLGSATGCSDFWSGQNNGQSIHLRRTNSH